MIRTVGARLGGTVLVVVVFGVVVVSGGGGVVVSGGAFRISNGASEISGLRSVPS